jgi:dTDP-4-amino-4,6-dideoxygalactose transaminase
MIALSKPTPFNKPSTDALELEYIQKALEEAQLSGDGNWTKKCHQWLRDHTGCLDALLTHSCTAALEMSSMLADFEEGDEFIVPSYTFVSSANAFVLRGGIPVFVDIRADTLNIDETKIEEAITKRTKAIVVVHYAGVACEMDTILEIAKKHNLYVIEDAAQGLGAKYKGKHLGTIGELGCYSFHATKNIISGEGGALLINSAEFIERAKIIREKGTNRSKFLRGEVDKYTWVDIGSSYLPSEVTAAFLLAQFEKSETITQKRLDIWNQYHENLKDLEEKGFLTRPIIPNDCEHNAHMYYVILPSEPMRNKLSAFLKDHQVHSVAHYVPLHSSPAGQKFGRIAGSMKHTDDLSGRMLRLPLWFGLETNQLHAITEQIENFFKL